MWAESRVMDRRAVSAADAAALVPDGVSVMIGGFLGVTDLVALTGATVILPADFPEMPVSTAATA